MSWTLPGSSLARRSRKSRGGAKPLNRGLPQRKESLLDFAKSLQPWHHQRWNPAPQIRGGDKMPSDFTVIEPVRQRFGDQNVREGEQQFEREAPFVGQSKDYPFPCPDVAS